MNNICLVKNLYKDITINSSISVILILMSLCIIFMVIYLENKFRRMNKNLYYREELFNSLCNNVDDVFTIYDIVNKKYEYISPNFEKILGINFRKLIQNPYIILDYATLEKKEEIIALLSLLIKSTLEINFEFNHPITHENRWLIVRIYPVFNHNDVIRYIFSITDVTQEMQSQMVLKEALLNVQKANEAKKDFLSHMSHELKTPINAIIGMTQIASRSFDDKEKAENCFNIINIASKKLLLIINNILDIAKADNDKLVLANESFCLSREITILSSIMNSQAELNNQEYIFKMDNINDDYLMGDSLRLQQILANCLSNSFKFTPQGGKIILEVSEIEKYANKVLFRFIVSDTGKGMSEEFIGRLFLPFEQENSTIFQKYGGTGLGMSITNNLVYLMGGNIRVASKVNVGTIITIDIVFNISPSSPVHEELNELKTNMTEYDCLGKRVLVVEDNEINLEITTEFLQYINADIETAQNGYDAIKLFEESDCGYYDAILMDIQMPGINGYEAAKVIRNSSHPDAKKVCIIAMTADNFAENESNMKYGVNYHIAKPIELEKFCSLLQNAITKEKTL